MESDGRGNRECEGVEILEVEEVIRNEGFGSERTFRVEKYWKGSIVKGSEEREK